MTIREVYLFAAGYHWCGHHRLWTRYECQAQ